MVKNTGRDQCVELVKFVGEELGRIAEPAKAPAMAAYMKTSQPFYGVARPKLNAALCKEMRLRFAPADRAAYERGVIALWRLPHRDCQIDPDSCNFYLRTLLVLRRWSKLPS